MTTKACSSFAADAPPRTISRTVDEGGNQHGRPQPSPRCTSRQRGRVARQDGPTSPREHPRQPQITREDLPADLTPETLRQVDFRILRAVSRHDNGILSPAEQEQFDAALREAVRGTSSFVNDSSSAAVVAVPPTSTRTCVVPTRASSSGLLTRRSAPTRDCPNSASTPNGLDHDSSSGGSTGLLS